MPDSAMGQMSPAHSADFRKVPKWISRTASQPSLVGMPLYSTSTASRFAVLASARTT